MTVFLHQHADRESCVLVTPSKGGNRKRKGDAVVLWKITNGFFPIPDASGQPGTSARQDLRTRGSGHRAEWLGGSGSSALS